MIGIVRHCIVIVIIMTANVVCVCVCKYSQLLFECCMTTRAHYIFLAFMMYFRVTNIAIMVNVPCSYLLCGSSYAIKD